MSKSMTSLNLNNTMPRSLDGTLLGNELTSRTILRREYAPDPVVWHRLKTFVEHLRHESRTRQVVGRADNPRLWHRHILDCVQLVTLIRGQDRHIVDFGSGNGLPGLVFAILRPELRVTFIDAHAGKCRFIFETAQAMDFRNVSVVHARLRSGWRSAAGFRQKYRLNRADVLLARAVAPPDQCYRLLRPLAHKRSRYIFPCGQSWSSEKLKIDAIPNMSWQTTPSRTSDESVIFVGDIIDSAPREHDGDIQDRDEFG